MMDFNDNKPIYRQIVDYACNLIVEGKWSPGGRIPSVRELSVEMGVNSRTVLKAMDELQDAEIIIPRRGLGFILAEDAVEKVSSSRRKEFFNSTVPLIAQEMKRLGIPVDELIDELKRL